MFLFFSLFFVIVKASINKEFIKSLPQQLQQIYNVVNELKRTPCNSALLEILNNEEKFKFYAKNSADTLNNLGNFDDCLMDISQARYFTMEISNVPMPLILGFCLPTQCRTDDLEPLKPSIAQIMTDLLKVTNIGFNMDHDITSDDLGFIDAVETKEIYGNLGIGFYITASIIVFQIGRAHV